MQPALPRPTSAVFALVARTGGARLLERAIPLFLGVAVASAIVFSPNGLDPRDVARMAASSPWLRAALWAAWLLASVPLAGVLLRDRRADVLRTLPMSVALPSVASAAWLLALQAPWVALWLRGAGVLVGLRAAVLGFGLTVLLATRARAAFETLLLAACLAAVGFDVAPPAALALAPLVALAAHRAWLRAPERPSASTSWVRGPAPAALAIAHHLRLIRSERFAAVRGFFVAALGGALAAVGARNTDRAGTTELVPFVLAVLAPALVVAASGVAAPLLDADAALDVVLRSAGATRRLRLGALSAVAATWGAAFGAAAFAAGRLVVGADLARDAALPIAGLGAALAAITVALAHRSAEPGARGRRNDGGRVVVVLGALAVAAAAAASFLGEVAVVALGVLAAAAWLVGPRAPSPRGVHPAPPPGAESDAILSVRRVAKRFGGREVLRGADLTVAPRTVAVLRGENGSGKSTLLRIIAGVVDKDAGSVVVAGACLDGARVRALRSVGYAPDAGELPDHLSVRELVALVAALRRAEPAPACDEERLGVAGLVHERLSSLSLGQRRRVGLLAALVGRPDLLLLDEPTNGLDAPGLALLEALLGEQRARGGSALVASHEAVFASRVADAVHRLDHGLVAAA